PRDRGPDAAYLHPAARLDRRDLAPGRRHRRHEHHAGQHHRAHARDRHPHGDRGARRQRAPAVPDRGGGGVHGGRPGRRRRRPRRGAPGETARHARGAVPAAGPARVRLRVRDRGGVRLHAGAQGRPARPSGGARRRLMGVRRMAARRPIVAAALLGGLLAGCMSTPAYERPATPLPSAWREAALQEDGATLVAANAEDGLAWPPAAGWRVFGAPELERLIATAHANNPHLKAAASRMVQAEARARAAAADLYPGLTGSGSAGRDGRGGSRLDPSYRTGLQAEYEVDFWGRNRAAVQSAEAALEASRFDRETVALSLTAEVATTWFEYLALSDRLSSARQQLEIARRVLDLVRAQAEWGAVSDLRVAQQRNTVATLEATLPTLERQRAEAGNALAVLLGLAPQELELPPAGSLGAVAVPRLEPGLPAELLQRRPDIRRAEADLVAANADVHAARAALFPSIRLTGGAGFASAALSSLFDVGGSFYDLVSGLTAPIFDAGRLRAGHELAK